MLSRRHIRVKVMQTLYGYYNEGLEKTSSRAQLTKGLEKNINKLYELYLYLLFILVELGEFARRYEEEARSKYIVNEKDTLNRKRFFDNSILQRLMNSEVLQKTASKLHVKWEADEDVLRRVFFDLKNQEIYSEYASFVGQNPVLEQEILTFIVKHYSTNLSLLQQHLEEQYYNWQDDRKIALQMAVKTIQTIAAEPDSDDYMAPLNINEDENYNYARELLKQTVENDENIQQLIASKIHKWESHQIALIDSIILKMAVSEFLYFPSIPVKVSINEYIELAKNYSTPQSKRFVNGVLDAILKDLRKEGKLVK